MDSRIIFTFILLSFASCSQEKKDSGLPNYGDMGAAADAGRIIATPVPENL